MSGAAALIPAWPAEDIWQQIEPLLPGFSVEVLASVDSTSSELMRRARGGRTEPTLLVAETQTAGRGRLGRQWKSAGVYEGTGVVPALTFSLGLPLAPQGWSGLSLAVGVTVAECLDGTGAEPRIRLKWPNDLWLAGDRKLGGILVETASFATGPQTAEQPRYVVVGIGLNVLPVLAEGLSTPPACLREVDTSLSAARALKRLALPLVQALLGFAEHGFAPFQPRFARRDVLAGRGVTLSNGQQGTAHGVSDEGALLVHTATGMQAITSAEISVRPQ
ncbi:biotin--[acetyl-CoA-carboxylase] ligase [Pulveribacter suum]|uniref:biotin--[biotin carboxyl-carrier protein] ligase n=1 Tax=Pulveribacter suum TaxID=2116657 RepID=A0A2P1NHA9_9BURK|nr:biotin--[acetyl-CoA-carboxylase] ligase [Pulveribacter suum]AVP56429.1 biotin--[acetyl-CoA-carboxylase] ligase [Pulveribacter suum]